MSSFRRHALKMLVLMGLWNALGSDSKSSLQHISLRSKEAVRDSGEFVLLPVGSLAVSSGCVGTVTLSGRGAETLAETGAAELVAARTVEARRRRLERWVEVPLLE